MHAKLWVIDGCIMLTGSCNATRNGFENNHEHSLWCAEAVAVCEAVTSFERIWADSHATDLVWGRIDGLGAALESSRSSRRSSRSASRSASRARGDDDRP